MEATREPDISHGRRLADIPVLQSRKGAPVPRLYGRMRLGGQLLWAETAKEHVHTEESGGGKSSTPSAVHHEYSYSLSFAVALCEGPVSGIGRIWVDGVPADLSAFSHRLYKGTHDQMPAPERAGCRFRHDPGLSWVGVYPV